MKPIFTLLLLCVLFSHKLAAQNDTLFVDSNTVNYTAKEIFDSCYKNLNLSSLTTGLLIDKAIPTLNISLFTGSVDDTVVADAWQWRRAYGTLHRAFADSTEAFDTLGKKVADMQQYLDSGYVPITIINYQYDHIKETAIADSLIYASGIQLFDVSGRTESPYETARCFMAAAAVNEVNHSVVQFVLNESFYISNDTRTIDHFEIDFADGNGFVSAALNDTIEITYDTAMALTLTLKAVFTDESQEQSDFALSTEQAQAEVITLPFYHTTPDDGDIVIADELYTGTSTYGKVKYTIRYGCGNQQEKKLRKPFFIVLGLSVPGKNSPEVSDGRQLLKEFLAQNPTFYSTLYYQGYDIIFVDYVDATIEIQNNAYALEKLISQVNAIKAANGSKHPNSYLGFSMGGLVGRYALTHMDGLHRSNPSVYPAHEFKVFYSYDSPHLGANIPLGTQFMIADMYNYYAYNGGFIPKVEWENVNGSYKHITSPAARAMLINYYNPSASLFNALYFELNNMNPNAPDALMIGCKSVAISNGSGDGIKQANVHHNAFLNGGDKLLDAGSQSNWATFVMETWAVPESASVSNKIVYKGSMSYKGPNGTIYFIKPHYGLARNSHCNGADGSPGGRAQLSQDLPLGGILPKLNLVGNGLNKVVYFDFYTLVPTISAVALSSSSNFYLPVNDKAQLALVPSNANDFITDDIQAQVGDRNSQHVKVKYENLQMFFKDMLAEAGSTIEDGETFNYGGVTTDQVGLVEVKDGATLVVNKNEQAGLTPQIVNSENLNKNPVPDNNSHSEVYTYLYDECYPNNPHLHIQSNGTLQIGDDGSNRTGDLIIRSGAKVTLENTANLAIYGNSKLVIEEGAELKIVGTPAILLNDANSVIEIYGQLTLDDNATFTYTGGGFVSFSCPDNSYCNVTSGNNCTINLEGTNRNTDKILDVKGKGLNLSGLTEFKLKSGYVELGTNTELVIEKDLHLENVYVTRPAANTNNYVYKGFVLQNQPSTSTVFIEDCLFEHATTAIKFTKATSGITQLAMSNTAFFACSLGVHTTGSSFLFSLLRFENCEQGWVADNVQDLSDFKGYMENVDYGITYYGNQGADLYVYESTFTGCTEAIDAGGDVVLTSRCSHYVSNTNDILKDLTDLNISDDVYFSRADPLNSVGNGGYNLFNNTTGNTIYVTGLTHLYAYKGYNEFIYSSNPMHVFDGEFNNVPSPHVRLEDNYWSLYNGSTQVYDLASASSGMWSVDDMYSSTAYYNTITTWSTHSTCTNAWDGEIVIEGMARDNTSTATKEIATTKNTFVIYPNPTDKLLHVQCTTQNSNYTLKAIDITGRIIYLQPTSRSTNTQSFDVSYLAAGLYQIMVEQGGVILTKQKVVVRR